DRRFEPLESEAGIYRYAKWLPSCRTLAGSTRTLTYRSERLISMVGLPNLWIAFHGHHPERDLPSGTCTFKDLEAYSVLARLDESAEGVLVVASAGNTAAAFARCGSLNGIRCLVIVPEAGLARMEFTEPLSPAVKIVAIESPADYAEAIAFAQNVA